MLLPENHMRRTAVQPHIWVWVWVMLAVIMTVSEIIAGGMYSLPFAIGAACAALAEWVRPGSITLQWLLFLGVSVVLFGILQRLRVRRRSGAS